MTAEHSVRLLATAGISDTEAFGLVRAVVAQVVGEAVPSRGPVSELGTVLVFDGLRARMGEDPGVAATGPVERARRRRPPR